LIAPIKLFWNNPVKNIIPMGIMPSLNKYPLWPKLNKIVCLPKQNITSPLFIHFHS